MIAPIAHTGQRSTTNLVPFSGRHITIKTVAGAALLRKGAVLQTYTVLPGYYDTTDDTRTGTRSLDQAVGLSFMLDEAEKDTQALEGVDGPLFLDEVGKHVSKEYAPSVAYFLKEYSATFGRQIILITHNADLAEIGEVSLAVKRSQSGESEVSVL